MIYCHDTRNMNNILLVFMSIQQSIIFRVSSSAKSNTCANLAELMSIYHYLPLIETRKNFYVSQLLLNIA
jgi:hypothetical protein